MLSTPSLTALIVQQYLEMYKDKKQLKLSQIYIIQYSN